jgi:hypothetical protein
VYDLTQPGSEQANGRALSTASALICVVMSKELEADCSELSLEAGESAQDSSGISSRMAESISESSKCMQSMDVHSSDLKEEMHGSEDS